MIITLNLEDIILLHSFHRLNCLGQFSSEGLFERLSQEENFDSDQTFLMTAVITALDLIDADHSIVTKLQENALEVHNHFEAIDGMTLNGDR